MADKILKKILDDDERNAQDLADKILKKFWMTMRENTQDLADKILKKFCMTMSEHSERKEKQKWKRVHEQRKQKTNKQKK